MAAVLEFDECQGEINSGSSPHTGRPMSNDGGSGMEDVLKRLGALEVQVGVVVATISHLATKADLNQLRAEIGCLETKMIKWIIATVISAAGLAFTIAKLIH